MYSKVCAEEKVEGIEFSGTPADKAKEHLARVNKMIPAA